MLPSLAPTRLVWAFVVLSTNFPASLVSSPLLLAQPARVPSERDSSELARAILDEQLSQDEREARVREAVGRAGQVVRAMVADLPPDDEEEQYRRIPWIWRVSIAAGRTLDREIVFPLFVASLPDEEEPLQDWQSVVLGGGVINGISLEQQWPREVIEGWLEGRSELRARWSRTLELAAEMADNEQVRKGTRYDALRILGVATWEESGEHLTRYLPSGVDGELQMGAVSGLVDIDAPEAATVLLDHLDQLTPGNRRLAIQGMMRTADRKTRLREALSRGRVERDWLSDEQFETLMRD